MKKIKVNSEVKAASGEVIGKVVDGKMVKVAEISDLLVAAFTTELFEDIDSKIGDAVDDAIVSGWVFNAQELRVFLGSAMDEIISKIEMSAGD